MNLLSTEQLVEVVQSNKNKYFEVELILDGGVATHFIYARDGLLFDEGIDGVEQDITPDIFADFYKGKLWNIFQVV